MPKYRKLHVKAVDSIDINEMPDDFTRLLWVMLPLGLDAAGRGLDNTSWIKARVMPLREDVTPHKIETAMVWYADHRMIRRYTVNGRNYFDVPTWTTYQGDTSKESKSNFPEYREEVAEAVNSGLTPDLLQSKSNVPASTCASTCESESASTAVAILAFGDHLPQRAERLYQQVTGQSSIPSTNRAQAEHDLIAVLDYYQGRDPPIDDGKRIFARWCSTTGKNGRGYSRLNPGWIAWWLEELAPIPIRVITKTPAEMTREEFTEYTRKLGETHA